MLRVTAHNNAGFTVAEYEFATLTVNGGELNCMQKILNTFWFLLRVSI